MIGRGESHVRHIAGVVVGHSGTGLPGRFGEENARSSTAGSQAAGAGFIPRGFRNIGKRRAEVRAIGGGPIIPAALVEHGAAHGGYFRNAGRKTHGQAFGGLQAGKRRIATGRAVIAGSGQPGDALRAGLLCDGPECGGVRRLAAAKAEADYRRQILVDGILAGGIDARRIDVNDGCIARHRAGPFQVKIRLAHVIAIGSGVGTVENHLRIVGGQVEAAPEVLDIREIDIGVPDDGDLLTGAIDAGVVKRIQVINGGEIVRGKVVCAAATVVSRVAGGHQPMHRLRIEVIESLEATHHAGQSGRNGGLRGGREMRLAFHVVAVNRGVKSAVNEPRRAGERDPVAAASDVVHLQAFGLQPRDDDRDVAGAEAETRGVLLGSQPLVVMGR